MVTWKPKKNIQKQAIQIGRVIEVLMEKLLELFPTLLLEISAGRYEFGWEASPYAVCCSSLLELCLVCPQAGRLSYFEIVQTNNNLKTKTPISRYIFKIFLDLY